MGIELAKASTSQVRSLLSQGRTLDEVAAILDIDISDLEVMVGAMELGTYGEKNPSLENLESKYRVDALKVLWKIAMDETQENVSARVQAAKIVYLGRGELEVDERTKLVEKLSTLKLEMQARVKEDLEKTLTKNITPATSATVSLS